MCRYMGFQLYILVAYLLGSKKTKWDGTYPRLVGICTIEYKVCTKLNKINIPKLLQ